MLQERPVEISTVSVEHETAQNIDLMELVSIFVKLKAQKENSLYSGVFHSVHILCKV
jgi:hypothetical protein